MICKLVYKKQIHLCSNLTDYKSLLGFVVSSFRNLPKNFEMTYADEEGDEIMLSNAEDLEVFKLIHINSKKFPKIYISETIHNKVINTSCNTDDSFEVIGEEEPRELLRQAYKIINDGIKDVCEAYVSSVGRRAIEKIQREDDEMREYLAKINCRMIAMRVTNKLMQEEEEEVRQLAHEAVERIGSRAIERYLSLYDDKPVRVNRHLSKSLDSKRNDERIERLVEKKVRLMLPSIIDRVTKAVESRLLRNKEYRRDFVNEENCYEYETVPMKSLMRFARDYKRNSYHQYV